MILGREGMEFTGKILHGLENNLIFAWAGWSKPIKTIIFVQNKTAK